ncbi:MAG TPA: GNAT family N-acetyltransferase [Gemmatimonadaceae bacterium]|jgi:GNAT superfamily N-acetyltransferase|nr:GNAT family N-acetyltransferase [Gemmatimonadaceae bacterium]
MPDHSVTIRPATPDDAAALAAFGERTFREAFGPDNRPEDVDVYVRATYSAERQGAEIIDPDRITFVGECDGALAAFAQLRANGKAPSCVDGRAPLELLRFYVDRPWQGRGVAHSLMDAVVAAARSRGARTLWLGVWERNPRAITFYGKHGFRDVGCQPFKLGGDDQTDRVMARSL